MTAFPSTTAHAATAIAAIVAEPPVTQRAVTTAAIVITPITAATTINYYYASLMDLWPGLSFGLKLSDAVLDAGFRREMYSAEMHFLPCCAIGAF